MLQISNCLSVNVCTFCTAKIGFQVVLVTVSSSKDLPEVNTLKSLKALLTDHKKLKKKLT